MFFQHRIHALLCISATLKINCETASFKLNTRFANSFNINTDDCD